MNRLSAVIIVAGALAVSGAAAALAGPVEERKELMKSNKDALKVLVPMAKGEAPFDEDRAIEALRSIQEVPDKFVELFPEGSGDHPKTEAAPKIWEDKEGFIKSAEDLKSASAETIEAAREGPEAFKAAVFGSLGKACKNCHDDYRIKKE